jgi:hypothetical protein
MVVVKKIGVLSFAKIEALMMAFIGLIEGILVAVTGPVIQAANSPEVPMELKLGAWAILILPIIYFVLGFVFGIIGSAIYNLFAKWVGGFEVELEDKGTAAKKIAKK